MILEQLITSRNVLLTTHTNPDGDALGSMIAMGQALASRGKQITFYNESSTPAVYRFLPSIESIRRHIHDLRVYDTAIVLDCSNIQRIGRLSSKIDQVPVVLNIDHHMTNTGFGTCQRVDPSACASAEIVYQLIKEIKVEISSDIAVAIYTGILTDTGSFRFANTNKAAFSICREMIELGVNPSKVAEFVFGTYSLERIKLLNKVLDSIEISENGKLSIMTLTQTMIEETGFVPDDVSNFINYAKHIEDVKVAALIREGKKNGSGKSMDANAFHISLRSDGTVDVSEIASTFGGGGHMNAAGFNIQAPLPDIKKKILNMAKYL